ncbi:MAG TPA: DUF2939 domain-containing protein [Chromatiales bacterium]|nr:DUF2939 domain-containing protein [Kiloniellaceae bacterium]HIP52770.1 DUF2939 domain-containing protein [Chromatiales bacterium]
MVFFSQMENSGRRWKRLGAVMLLLLIGAWLAWPYVTLLRLERAAVAGNAATLEEIVDLDAVRTEIEKRLNKEMQSSIGEVSNAFVDWLQQGVMRLGSEAVDVLVTTDWVREQLLAKSSGGSDGFLRHISYAFYESPVIFLVRIGAADDDPVFLRMRLDGLRWRITAVYG